MKIQRNWLQIITYVGTVVTWAKHYTGYIKDDTGERVFSTPRRTSEEQVIRDVRRWAKENPGVVLIKADYGYCDPFEMLVGPRELKSAANALWRKFDKNGGWYQGDMRTIPPEAVEMEKQSRKISDEWNALFGVHYT